MSIGSPINEQASLRLLAPMIMKAILIRILELEISIDESFQGTEVPNLVPGSISSAATLMNAKAEYIWSKSLWFVGWIVLWLGMLFQDTPPLYLTEISKTERI